MKISLPINNEPITKELIEKNWYDYFDGLYNKVIGYFDSSLTATVYQDSETEGNVDGTETAISNFVIKNTKLTSNEVIEVFVGGTYASNGNNKTIRLKINASTYYTKTVSTSGGAWQISVKIINLGTTQKIFINNGAYIYTTTSIDTSTTNFDLILTLQGVASNDIVKEYYEIKFNK